MSDVNTRFRKRIGIPNDTVIKFENLDTVLEKTSLALPFENLCIIEGRAAEITKENLLKKIVDRNEGGLCYELNTILYLFLRENGFDISLVRGVVYEQAGQQWSKTGKTHVTNLVTVDGAQYLVDTGFGGNIPLTPVPLTGEMVHSSNGEFRVEQEKSDHGDYIFYVKLKHRDKEWRIGYAFDSNDVIKNHEDLTAIQKIITAHPDSAFNKKPLVTRLTATGNKTLTETSFTEWDNGKMEKQEMTKELFKVIAEEQFGLKI